MLLYSNDADRCRVLGKLVSFEYLTRFAGNGRLLSLLGPRTMVRPLLFLSRLMAKATSTRRAMLVSTVTSPAAMNHLLAPSLKASLVNVVRGGKPKVFGPFSRSC